MIGDWWAVGDRGALPRFRLRKGLRHDGLRGRGEQGEIVVHVLMSNCACRDSIVDLERNSIVYARRPAKYRVGGSEAALHSCRSLSLSLAVRCAEMAVP